MLRFHSSSDRKPLPSLSRNATPDARQDTKNMDIKVQSIDSRFRWEIESDEVKDRPGSGMIIVYNERQQQVEVQDENWLQAGWQDKCNDRLILFQNYHHHHRISSRIYCWVELSWRQDEGDEWGRTERGCWVGMKTGMKEWSEIQPLPSLDYHDSHQIQVCIKSRSVSALSLKRVNLKLDSCLTSIL